MNLGIIEVKVSVTLQLSHSFEHGRNFSMSLCLKHYVNDIQVYVFDHVCYQTKCSVSLCSVCDFYPDTTVRQQFYYWSCFNPGSSYKLTDDSMMIKSCLEVFL